MKDLLIGSVPWLLLGGIFLLFFKLFSALRKKVENPIIDEREALIRMRVEKVKWLAEASFLYLAVFLPLLIERPVFWGIPLMYAFNLCFGLTFGAKLIADYYYRKEA
jgi:hypothetical protein